MANPAGDHVRVVNMTIHREKIPEIERRLHEVADRRGSIPGLKRWTTAVDRERSMVTPPETSIDLGTVQRLSERFAEVFSTFEARDDTFAPNAFFDLNMPVWRFQLEGADSFAAQLKSINEGIVSIEIVRTVPTISGFVTEHVEHQNVGGSEVTARRIWLCEVEHGRIVEAVGYCSGEWDEDLRARHATEAPMIR